MTSPIINFYKGTGTDDQGRTLEEILGWDFQKLEDIHNYIQWLFPLTDRSSANWKAPVLTEQEIDEIRTSELIRNNLVRSFRHMMEFYGFETVEKNQGKSFSDPDLELDKKKGFDLREEIEGNFFNKENAASPKESNFISLKRSPAFTKRAANWLTRGNHNFLRMTRIMKSMNFANLKNYSLALFGELKKLYESDYGTVIGSTTFRYWEVAAGKS